VKNKVQHCQLFNSNVENKRNIEETSTAALLGLFNETVKIKTYKVDYPMNVLDTSVQ